MKILWLCPFVPYPPDTGGNIRVFSLLRELGRKHEITLVCLHETDEKTLTVSPLLEACREVHFLPSPTFLPLKLHHARGFFSRRPVSIALDSERILYRLAEIARRDNFDLLQVEFLPLAQMALRLPVPIRLLTEHYLAVEAYTAYVKQLNGLRRWYFHRELHKMNQWEPQILRQFSHVIVTSNRHADLVSSWIGKKHVTVVPNGVDVSYFTPSESKASNNHFIFMGSFHLDPANLQALNILVERLLPELIKQIPDLVIHVVGKGIPANMRVLGHTNLQFHGYVDDVRPLLASAAAMLLPIVGGSGTKIRLLTAMSMAKVVITTPDGLAGLDCKEGREVLVSRSLEEMVQTAVRVSRDPRLRDEIGNEARRAVLERFSWSGIARVQAELWERVACTLVQAGKSV